MSLKIFNNKNKLVAPWKKYYNDEDLNIKIPNINMYDQILSFEKKYPDNIVYEYFTTKVTYKKFIEKIDACAISFKRLGINKGNIVTICLPNVPEALVAIYALNKIGAVANMLHPLSAEQEIKDSILRTKSKILIMTDMFYSKIENTYNDLNLKKIVFVSISNSLKPILKIGYKIKTLNKNKKYPKNNLFISWNKFISLSNTNIEYKFKKYDKNTPAVILHSGGTSGKPKNVVIQNRAFILLTEQEKIVLKKLNIGDSCLAIMPNFHGFGLGVAMHAQMTLGIKVILVPTFDSKKFDILLNKTKPQLILGVPTLFEALKNSNNVNNLDLSCIKYIISGGDSLSKGLEDDVNEYLKKHNCKVSLTQGYGLSEALSAVCLGFDNINKSGSIGIPLPGNYIKIINTSTRENCAFNEIGEICIHNDALMMGYLNEESETNDALQVHDDGFVWLHTGDLGYMDEDGFIFYKCRQKRMIISSGYNVYPGYVESVIESHPAVLQCTVVSMPHPYKKEVPKAFIVLKSGFHGLFIKQEIKEYCKKNLEHHAIPYQFVYRKKLPTTKLGKVDFNALSKDLGSDDDE